MLMEIWYMIFLSAHLEISLLKFKALTLGVDGQPAEVQSFDPWC
jgi:hypothetical protein